MQVYKSILFKDDGFYFFLNLELSNQTIFLLPIRILMNINIYLFFYIIIIINISNINYLIFTIHICINKVYSCLFDSLTLVLLII